MNELERMDYESPIKVLCSEMVTNLENGVYSTIQKFVLDVDKDELIKALNYDREQYDKGFKAGYHAALIEFTDFISETKGREIR